MTDLPNRKAIPSKTKKLIFQEAQSQCPFCGESDIDVLEIHHIDNEGGNDPENLILACSNCHSKITSGSIVESIVRAMKLRLIKQTNDLPARSKTTNVITISGGQNSGVIANVVNLQTKRKSSQKLAHPLGSIGANLLYRNYIKYLIDRYNEFKKTDKSNEKFSYAVIYKAIQNQFKAKWDFLPTERFWDLVEFMQNRIDKTILGKVQKSRGHKNYESLEEYKSKMEV